MGFERLHRAGTLPRRGAIVEPGSSTNVGRSLGRSVERCVQIGHVLALAGACARTIASRVLARQRRRMNHRGYTSAAASSAVTVTAPARPRGEPPTLA